MSTSESFILCSVCCKPVVRKSSNHKLCYAHTDRKDKLQSDSDVTPSICKGCTPTPAKCKKCLQRNDNYNESKKWLGTKCRCGRKMERYPVGDPRNRKKICDICLNKNKKAHIEWLRGNHRRLRLAYKWWVANGCNLKPVPCGPWGWGMRLRKSLPYKITEFELRGLSCSDEHWEWLEDRVAEGKHERIKSINRKKAGVTKQEELIKETIGCFQPRQRNARHSTRKELMLLGYL